jgi:hypothetical protein
MTTLAKLNLEGVEPITTDVGKGAKMDAICALGALYFAHFECIGCESNAMS